MISTTLKLSEFFACGDGLIEFPYGLTGWYKLARPDMLPNYALKSNYSNAVAFSIGTVMKRHI